MHKQNDSILVNRIIKGEQHLFNILIERHKKYAFNIALKILDNAEDAEEVAHDSFIKAYKNLHKFNQEAKFSTWLYRITFNTSITAKRKQKHKNEEIDDAKHDFQQAEANLLEKKDQKHYINLALKQLSDVDQTIISLFYLKEFSLEEIADITNMDANNVKVKLHRARKKMAKEMQNILKGEALNL
ncbi:RNA polymerase sigma factor [Fulvivirga maritima]|uniref:RNA polymerase sigma factor n=1 Tax=Fulvivirga maritima TaxID=2904247 RepID=UPI001F28ADD4|nr:RNA polymerase sigma factor [Fulvivirga maritima]UII27459.1 RNA polymerase sigma factor [Fulvivirga maritima]